MAWNGNKIKSLRQRMGWTQSELARKLECDFDLIREWEASSDESTSDSVVSYIKLHTDNLVLLEKQADLHSDHVIHAALAESILEEANETQVHLTAVKRHFFEKN
jgi:transcriptional regulator with XRE-family HTH domain